MRIIKEVIIPEYKRKMTSSILCDVCKRETKKITGDTKTDWAIDHFDIDETTLLRKDGAVYPEGGSWIETSCDLCPKCFQKHVIEHLESLGVSWRVEEHDF